MEESVPTVITVGVCREEIEPPPAPPGHVADAPVQPETQPPPAATSSIQALARSSASESLAHKDGTGIASKDTKDDVLKSMATADKISILHGDGAHALADGAQNAANAVAQGAGAIYDMTGIGTLFGERVKWAWLHKSGWRDYDEPESLMIEKAYVAGHSLVRLKTGKDGKTPKEVYFEDMIQFDPTSGNSRKVQRLGPMTLQHKIERFVNGITKQVETGQPRRQTFDDYQRRREELREEIKDANYLEKVSDGYHDGVTAAIARSPYFFATTMALVIFNAVWLMIDQDYNTSSSLFDPAAKTFLVMEILFIIFFVSELVIRFCAYRTRRDCLTDKWFLFDLFLVLLMLFEITVDAIEHSSAPGSSQSPVSSLRVLRMLRLLRLTKMFRMLPNLLMLVKGIAAAISPMFYTALLLLVLLYSFAVFFRSQTRSAISTVEPDVTHLFRNVPHGMINCLFYGTLLDGPTGVFDALWADVGGITAAAFVALILTSAFTVLNMLIGVLCEVVSAVSSDEKAKAEVKYLQNNLLCVLMAYDKDGDCTIGKKEFEFFLENPEVHDALAKFGTDVKGLQSLKAVMYESSDNLSFDDILQTILRLRGDNVAKVTDIIELREFVRLRTKNTNPQVCDKGEPVKAPPEAPWDAIMSRLDAIAAAQSEMRQEVRLLHDKVNALESSATTTKRCDDPPLLSGLNVLQA